MTAPVLYFSFDLLILNTVHYHQCHRCLNNQQLSPNQPSDVGLADCIRQTSFNQNQRENISSYLYNYPLIKRKS